MKLLPIWRFTHTLPSHKDSESATVIEQTYKLYQTMQELITECNEFSENVNNKIIEFVTKYEEDIDTFTTSFRQEYQDFIDVVELKLENQDKRIQEIGQTVLEYIQPIVDEFLTAIENNLREELLTLINDNVTPQIQNIDNQLSWINDTIACIEDTQNKHSSKLDELDYRKAERELVEIHEAKIHQTVEWLTNVDQRVDTLEEKENELITPEKTTFVEASRNLYDMNNIENISRKYLNRGTGVEMSNSSYCISHYIEVVPGERFICNKELYSYAWYTADKTLLYGSTTGFPAGIPFNISTNAKVKYIRICFSRTELNGLQFERGNEITKYRVYGELEIPNLKIDDKTFHVGANQEIKTLKEGIEIATRYNGATLYVDDGVYDLVSEFGQEYLDNNNSDKGLELKNNIHVIFSSRAKVIFNYTGNNAYIHKEFSPFNAGVYGFTLENLTLECSNCRYAIHDERGGSTDKYHNRYINMKISTDNSNNPNWANQHNIGGGLGNDGYIEVIGNIFNNAVTYHNNNNTGYTKSKSKVIIKDNYFSAGGVICEGYGSSTEITEFLVVNNSMDWLYTKTENANNINVSAFNNIVKYPN